MKTKQAKPVPKPVPKPGIVTVKIPVGRTVTSRELQALMQIASEMTMRKLTSEDAKISFHETAQRRFVRTVALMEIHIQCLMFDEPFWFGFAQGFEFAHAHLTLKANTA